MVHDPARVGLRALADLATPMAIRVAATLRVADHVAAGRDTAASIATATGADPDAMDRLLRHLVTVGLFGRLESGGYTLTAAGEPLREDHDRTRRAWLDISGAVGRGDLAFVDLLHAVRTGKPAYPERYGVGFWDDLRSDRALSESFHALMGRHIALDGDQLAASYDWAACAHVVDVGGGSGALLASLLEAYPDLRGTIVDQPAPVREARLRLRERGLDGRGTAVVGDFFGPLPPGADAYVLSAIIHDWDDDRAVAILRRCAAAASPDGVVLVVENLGADGDSPDTGMDLRMLVYIAGRERGLDELRAIAERAGLLVRGVHPVGDRRTVSIVELGHRSARPPGLGTHR